MGRPEEVDSTKIVLSFDKFIEKQSIQIQIIKKAIRVFSIVEYFLITGLIFHKWFILD